jgi:dienelactone hydrolase
MASTFRSSAILTVLLALAAGAWVISGQTTSRPLDETVVYTNDGLRLEAYLYWPAGPGPFPLVIHRHSGDEPAPRWGAIVGRLLTETGYALLAVERRGVGKSEGGELPVAVLRGQRGVEATGEDRDRVARLRVARLTAEAGDVLAGLEHVTRDRASRIDVQRIAIMGYSAGGSVAVLAAARSDRFRAVITQAPNAVNWTREAALREAVIRAARNLHVPTLCMVAENDNTTESARSVCDALKAAGAAANLIT